MTAPLDTIPTEVLGGVGLTHLKIYEDRPAPDGKQSGCAHVHAVTDEAYYAIAGEGYLELHDAENGFRVAPLTPGTFVQFTPGTIHRAVSTAGLEVVVLIGNAGLAERGDARIYFGPGVDANPDEYRRLAGLPKAKGREGALERRDASIEGYMGLMELRERDPRAYLNEVNRFVTLHCREMEALRERFAAIVEAGPGKWTNIVRERIEALPDRLAAPGTLTAGPGDEPVLGMCGTLHPVGGLQALATLTADMAVPSA